MYTCELVYQGLMVNVSLGGQVNFVNLLNKWKHLCPMERYKNLSLGETDQALCDVSILRCFFTVDKTLNNIVDKLWRNNLHKWEPHRLGANRFCHAFY